MKLGSLFDGIGAFPLAASQLGITPVWASEIEPFPILVTSKRFQNMKHLGDISSINGAELEPVDIITFGSPCQDWSIAGNREGIEGKRSGLFWEAVRVIGEMLDATGGEYPKAIIFENVPGLLSSGVKKRGNQKDYTQSDFAVVLRALQDLGFVLDPNILDAQYMGVPQRRRRVFIAGINANYIERWPEYDEQQGQANADSTGQLRFFGDSHDSDDNIVRLRACAIALERYLSTQRAGSVYSVGEGVSGDNTPCEEARKGIAGTAADCASGTNTEITQGGVMAFGETGIGYWQNGVQCLRAEGDNRPGSPSSLIVSQLYENHAQDCRVTGPLDASPTVSQKWGTGGNNTPIVALTNRGNYSSEVTETIRAESHGAVPMVAVDCRNFNINEEISATLQAKPGGGHSLNYINPVWIRHIVRRLMPCEGLKLQGFPPDWCDGVRIAEPSETDIHWWSKVFETKRLIANPTGKKGEPTKPKSRNQIIKWLKNPYSDSAVYRAAGNSAALPCVRFVMAQVKLVLERMDNT